MPAATPTALPDPLPLFPLQTVLFPGGQLGLKVFEARYLDLASQCVREGTPFGVVCLSQGREAGPQAAAVSMETVGVLAHIDELDAMQAGIVHLRCSAVQRFRLLQTPAQQRNGLWVGQAQLMPRDAPHTPGPAMLATVQALGEAIRKLQQLQRLPFKGPFRLDDAGWVANRWCELLPLALHAKQKLMELQDPVVRLSLVDAYLRDKKVVFGP